VNTTQRPALLARKRTELEDRLARIRRDLHRAEGPAPADSGERAVAVENDEVLEQLEASTREELGSVIRAIDRMATGEGEVCETCGHPIEAARLHAVPHATRCRSCSGIAVPSRKH
jgi:RNA polymerase-binding transcription factor DksA